MTEPPRIIEWPPPPRAANNAQAASAALGVTGLALTIAGASASTSEAMLGAGRDAVVQAAMLFGFGTVPASLRWGIVVTAVSVALNLVSLWLRYTYKPEAKKTSSVSN